MALRPTDLKTPLAIDPHADGSQSTEEEINAFIERGMKPLNSLVNKPPTTIPVVTPEAPAKTTTVIEGPSGQEKA